MCLKLPGLIYEKRRGLLVGKNIHRKLKYVDEKLAAYSSLTARFEINDSLETQRLQGFVSS
jgi:hypothetical protein